MEIIENNNDDDTHPPLPLPPSISDTSLWDILMNEIYSTDQKMEYFAALWKLSIARNVLVPLSNCHHDEDCRKLNDDHVLALRIALMESPEILHRIPLIAQETSTGAYNIIDGNHRVAALTALNVHEFRIDYLIDSGRPLTAGQKIILCSIGETKVDEFNLKYNREEALKNSRYILQECPELIPPFPIPYDPKWTSAQKAGAYGRHVREKLAELLHVSADLIWWTIPKIVEIDNDHHFN